METLRPHRLDPIPFGAARTLPELFVLRCERSPQGEAYRQFDPATQRWRGFSWDEMRVRVARWRQALAREGLAPGERVAVLLRNSVEWVCFDQAALSLGLVVVPLYPTDSAANSAYVLADSGARLLLLDHADRWHALEPLTAAMPPPVRVLCVTGGAGPASAGVLRSLDGWLAQPGPAAAPAAEGGADPEALATLVYTSGTTGRPKGVMLSHRNILSNVHAVLERVAVYGDDLFLSFLPLSHMLERTAGYYLPMCGGATVAFARSVPQLPEDLQALRPTVLVSVPRVYERVYAKIQQELEARGPAARALFAWAAETGWRRFEAAQHRGRGPGLVDTLAWPLLRRLVAARILARLGGRLRVAVCGGAAVSARLAHGLVGLGLPLLQGYGLTEAAPVVTGNALEDNVPESVGLPLPGIEVRLGAQDELLVRGPNVMRGYWNDPARTRAVLDADGWLRTGDIARLDARGRVYIVGRLKEILVTSTGEKLPLADAEAAIMEDPLFAQVMLVGEGRPYVAALAVLDPEAWRAFAAGLGMDPAEPEALRQPEVLRALLRRLQDRLGGFPACARVRALWPTLQPWTVDEGLLTPTLKLRRPQLEQRFAGPIDALYAERAPA